VPVPDEPHAGKRGSPARFENDGGEAEIVRRIFRGYAAGQSMKVLAHQLNADAVPVSGEGHEARPSSARLGSLDDLHDPAQREVRGRLGLEQDAVPEGSGQWPAPARLASTDGMDQAEPSGAAHRR